MLIDLQKIRRMAKRRICCAAAVSLLIVLSGVQNAAAQVTWKLAPGRTSIQFRVKHFVLMNVEGKFKNYEGTVVTSDLRDFTDAQVQATIPVRSIYTGNSDRDSHLLQEVFFHAEKYPEISFKSLDVRRVDQDNYVMRGLLTIRGVSRQIELDVVRTGFKEYEDGKIRSSFKAVGELNRYDFGLKWNDLTETGGMVVDEMVQIVMEVALIKAS